MDGQHAGTSIGGAAAAIDKRRRKPVDDKKKGDRKTVGIPRYINGPVNVIRLEGEVAGIRKVLYVLMDIHLDVSEQSKCANLRSKDVDKFLLEKFDELSASGSDRAYD